MLPERRLNIDMLLENVEIETKDVDSEDDFEMHFQFPDVVRIVDISSF